MPVKTALAKLVVMLIAIFTLPIVSGCFGGQTGCGFPPPPMGSIAQRNCGMALRAKEFRQFQTEKQECIRHEGNKAIVAATEAKAYGGVPRSYATPKHLDECDYPDVEFAPPPQQQRRYYVNPQPQQQIYVPRRRW